MRIWVDITDASAVVFFAPVIRRLEDAGHTVTLTARRFAGADLVLRRYGLGGLLTTQHRGGSLGTRAVGLVNRTAQLIGSASSGRFDVACGSHASDFVLTAWTLAIPQMTFLDPDRLGRSNLVNVRLVDEVAVPEAVPVSALAGMGAPRDKLFRYPGFKEEYYLHDAQPDPDALARLGRRAPAHHRRRAAAGAAHARAGGRVPGSPTRTGSSRCWPGSPDAATSPSSSSRATRPSGRGSWPWASPSVLVPDGPVDGVGLMAAADFVVGLGGVMLREAAALGTPAYTLSASAGPVEASLLGDGRLTPGGNRRRHPAAQEGHADHGRRAPRPRPLRRPARRPRPRPAAAGSASAA